MKRMAWILAGVLATAAAAWAQDSARPAEAPQRANEPRPALQASTPGGARLVVRLDETLSTRQSRPGDAWTGVLARDARVGDETIARVGDEVRGVVVESTSGGGSEPARLALRVTEVNGLRAASTVVAFRSEDPSRGPYAPGPDENRAATTAAQGAIAGGLIGAIASNSGGGALVGALIGGVAGGVFGHRMGKKQVAAPAETVVIFTTLGARPSSLSSAGAEAQTTSSEGSSTPTEARGEGDGGAAAAPAENGAQ